MPCWPTVWETLRNEAKPALVAIFFVAAVAIMLCAPGIKQRWVKNLLRILGSAAALFATALVLLMYLMARSDPAPQYVALSSPTGLREATLTYEAGFLGRDVSIVKVTTKGSCKPYTAYVYEGPSEITGTLLNWTDDSHLRISYYLDMQRNQRCERRAGDVVITCILLSRTNPK